MTKGRWIAVVAAGLLIGGPASADQVADEAAVRQTVNRLFAAYAKKDLAGFMTGWSPRAPDLAARRTNMETIFAETGPIELTNLTLATVSVQGDTARVRVRVALAGNAHATGKPYHQFGRLNRTLTLAREGGNWKILGYVPAETDLAARVVAAGNREARQRLLAGDEKDLVGPALALAVRDRALQLAQAGKPSDAVAALDAAGELAADLGDKDTQAEVRLSYGYFREQRHQYPEAIAETQRALALYREASNRIGEAKALYNLGNHNAAAGRAAEAVTWYDASLAVSRAAHFRTGESYALQNSAAKLESLGRYAEALDRYLATLALRIAAGQSADEMRTRSALAALLQKMGRFPDALLEYQTYLALARRLGDVDREAGALLEIGNVYAATGRTAEALALYEGCLTAARARRDQTSERSALTDIGLVYANLGRYVEAVAHQEEAVAIARAMRDRPAEASIRMNLGTAYSDAGRSAEARREYEAALAVYRDLGDHAGQMHTLGNLANLDLRAGNYAAALAAYEANLKTARDLGRRPSVAIAHNNLGKVLLQVGRFREAGEQFDASLRLAREMTQRETEAYALDGLGEAALKQGRYPEALRQHEAAREVYRAMGHRRGEADAVANTSVVYKAMGRYGEALARIQTSLAARREIGDRTGEVTTLNNLSLALAQAGRYEESARQAEAALKIARTQGRARSEAIALKSLGDCATARGRFDEALPFYEAALAINRANHYRDDEAYALAGRAWCLMRLGRDADAFEDYTAGRAILAELGLRGAEAAILVSIADVLIGRKEYDRARGLLQDATALAEPLADAQTLGRAYVALGASYAWQKRWSEAVAAYRQAIARFESVRADLRDPGLQASYLGRSMAPYTNLTACLLDQGGPTAAADAFRAAEQAKARTLVDLLGQGKADLRKGMTDAERREDERLQADVSALTVQLQRMQADHVEAARQKELARRLADARGESDLFRQQVFLAHPEFQTRQARFEPATPEELNRTLFAREPGLCIVDYLIDNNELLVFTLRAGPAGGPARLAIKRLEFGDTKIAAAVAAFRAGCQSPAQPVPDSKLLYEKLLAPVAEDLAGATHVILVPDGALHMLPFQALADGQGRYLVERLPVSYAPSVTALVKMAELAERRRHEGGASGVLAVGRPAYGGSLPDLPASEAEARTVAALYGGRSTVLLGAQADRASVLAALPAAGRVHLATHGLLSEANPLYSAVALSPKGDNDDGRLYARDLLDLDLHADLVVLSACETALGQEVKGEGVLGLAWALFAAGSPSSVVTQWSVADASTAAVMAEFHKRLAAGAPKAEALRAAQLALLDRYDLATGQLRGVGGVAVDTTARTAGTRLHPFYWAPFVLIGDWR